MIDGLSARLTGIDCIPTNISNTGNTVSSSIPILMAEYLDVINDSTSVLSGFGVGLSTATVLISNLDTSLKH